MPLISYLSLLFIATGIAADNLMVAGISGNGWAFFKNKTWILILILVFIIQNQVLSYGEWLGGRTQPAMNGIEQWFAIAGILLISFKMFLELKTKNSMSKDLSLHFNNFLRLIFGTSFSVFVFGFCMHNLNIADKKTNLVLLPLLIFFICIGIILGKYDCHKILKWMNIAAALFVLAGGIILSIQKVEGIF